MKKLLILLIMFQGLLSFAQPRKCVTLGETSHTFIPQGNLDFPDTMYVPVAVHVLGYNGTRECLENHCQLVMNQLNNDFWGLGYNHKNALVDKKFYNDTLELGNTITKFFLATKDHPTNWLLEEGQPAITINADTLMNYYGDGYFEFIDGGLGYLNIIVMDPPVNLLGYSPIGGMGDGDGVVINSFAFGATTGSNYTQTWCGSGGESIGQNSSYKWNRTTTHEVGHYFGLPHVFSDEGTCFDNDGFDDTAPQDLPVFEVGIEPSFSCDSYNHDMNFLSYVEDRHMYMLSPQQADKVNTHTFIFLKSLWEEYLTKGYVIQEQVDTTSQEPIDTLVEVPVDTVVTIDTTVVEEVDSVDVIDEELLDTIRTGSKIWVPIVILGMILLVGLLSMKMKTD